MISSDMQAIPLNRQRWIEMLFGLLAASIMIGPLLEIGMWMVFLTLAFSIVDGMNLFTGLGLSVAGWLSIFGAAAGLAALWLVFLFGPVQLRARRVLHFLITLSLVCGLAADAYWLREIARTHDPHWYVKTEWLWALLGPIVLAFKYLFLLFRQADDPENSGRA